MAEGVGGGEPLDAEGALVDRELGVARDGRNAVGPSEPDTALKGAVRAVGRGVRRGGGESGHGIQGVERVDVSLSICIQWASVNQIVHNLQKITNKLVNQAKKMQNCQKMCAFVRLLTTLLSYAA